MSQVLVTGGAGFIGSHLVDRLVAAGHQVTVFDNLDPAAHPQPGIWPGYCNPKCRYVLGDVRDRQALAAVLADAEYVFHLAAAVGSGISMVEVAHFLEVNTLATGILLELLIERRGRIRKLIVASSMTAMGEGTYRCPRDGTQYPGLRPLEQLERNDWEPKCPHCGGELSAQAMAEDRPLNPVTIYGLSKKDQEEASLLVGRAYGIPTVAFRFFSVYGPRQSLTNPYTGVIARFAARMITGKPPLIYEDGRQLKDVIHVSDVVAALLLAMDASAVESAVFNLGCGEPLSVTGIAELLRTSLGSALQPRYTGQFRAGDARHGWANIARAQAQLGWQPRMTTSAGFADLCSWLTSLPATQIEAAAAAFEAAESRAEHGKGAAL